MYKFLELLNVMVEAEASDLYVSVGAYPMLKIHGETIPLEKDLVTPEMVDALQVEMMSETKRQLFESENDLDYTYSLDGIGRFRVNFFRQRNHKSFVIRKIELKIKALEELNLPPILGELVTQPRGLILVVGATGSGKSTTMAAMVDHRNTTMTGHILTLEDPIEFIHQHKKSIINQREIGDDSHSFQNALKSALREAPSMLLIGEIRDKDTMSAALNFSETGHLVLSTLHANNAYQAIERIMSFYNADQLPMIRLQLSQNLLGVVGQRLVPTIDGNRVAALEIMLDSARIKDLISRGEIELLRYTIQNSVNEGMILFDQSLFNLYNNEIIYEDTAVQFADRPGDLNLQIRSQNDRDDHMEIALKDNDEE